MRREGGGWRWLLAVCLWAAPLAAWAGEDVRALWLAPVWWQYAEHSAARAGFAATPFDSSARGEGVRLGAHLGDAWDAEGRWRIELDASVMQSLRRAREIWRLPAQRQENRLEMMDVDARLGVGRRWDGAAGEGLLAVEAGWSWQRQRRTRFVVGGAPVAVPGGMVEERVQAAWLGGGLRWRGEESGMGIALHAAAPVWVRVVNTQVGRFDRKAGWRWSAQAEMRWPGDGARLWLRWQERRLGGDARSFGLWPENRYREADLGLEWRW